MERQTTEVRAAEARQSVPAREDALEAPPVTAAGSLRLDPAGVTHLQRTIGNRAVQRVLSKQGQAKRRLARKLVLTGAGPDLARVVALMNSGLGPENEAQLSAAGEVTIVAARGFGPSSTQQEMFTARLRALVSEAGTTTVGVVAGGEPIVGSYALQQIDIADMEALGYNQRGWDARAALLHELIEQREKQLGTTATQRGYPAAHGVALGVELGYIGAALESDSGLVGATANADGTMNGSREVIFRYPDGSRYRVNVTLTHNNITAVTRAKL